MNGVVHCLPFLSKIWQSKGKDLGSVTEEDLQSAGISKAIDRSNILLSIRQFFDNDRPTSASAPVKHLDGGVAASAAGAANDGQRVVIDEMAKGEFMVECVICMENSVSLFGVVTERYLLDFPDMSSSIYKFFFSIFCPQCQIIFIPCGHMCCCQNCHGDVQLCPMCRSEIDRRIKVIQP